MRFLFLSGMSFVAAIVAGRLTSHVPTKWLIAPGFLVAALGLFLMRGIEASADTSQWTHLIPGPDRRRDRHRLRSTCRWPPPRSAWSRPERSGMASGVNSTFRQVGIATGIAALGSIFAHQVTNGIAAALAGTPGASRARRCRWRCRPDGRSS